jgi:hypothetical protein
LRQFPQLLFVCLLTGHKRNIYGIFGEKRACNGWQEAPIFQKVIGKSRSLFLEKNRHFSTKIEFQSGSSVKENPIHFKITSKYLYKNLYKY